MRRAKDSAKNFSAGLSSVHPDLVIEPPESNENLLKYSGENEKYEDFLDGGPWKDAYNKVRRISKVSTVATEVLEHLYTPEFVAGVDNKLTEASGVFDFYRAGPAQSRDINVDTAKYMTEKGAETFAYVEDGRYFYSRGPGMEGENDTYQAAQILLDDFFKVIDDRLEGRGPHPHAAVYRFAHAEELTPFAAMLAIPGSDEPGKPGETYTHENNDFRIARVAPLSGSIAWVVWEKGDTHLVSVSHNEVPTTVGRDCELYEDTKNFYELEELRTCLGATELTDERDGVGVDVRDHSEHADDECAPVTSVATPSPHRRLPNRVRRTCRRPAPVERRSRNREPAGARRSDSARAHDPAARRL